MGWDFSENEELVEYDGDAVKACTFDATQKRPLRWHTGCSSTTNGVREWHSRSLVRGRAPDADDQRPQDSAAVRGRRAGAPAQAPMQLKRTCPSLSSHWQLASGAVAQAQLVQLAGSSTHQ